MYKHSNPGISDTTNENEARLYFHDCTALYRGPNMAGGLPLGLIRQLTMTADPLVSKHLYNEPCYSLATHQVFYDSKKDRWTISVTLTGAKQIAPQAKPGLL